MIYFISSIDDDFEKMAVVVRNLWFRRNSLIHGGNFCHSNQIVCKAMEEALNDFKSGQARPNGNGDGVEW